MSWSISASGKAKDVLEAIDKQIQAEIAYAEKWVADEVPIIRAHLNAFRQFLSAKLSNLGSTGGVEVTAWGHKAEGAVHNMEMRIKPLAEEVIQNLTPEEEAAQAEAEKLAKEAETVVKNETETSLADIKQTVHDLSDPPAEVALPPNGDSSSR